MRLLVESLHFRLLSFSNRLGARKIRCAANRATPTQFGFFDFEPKPKHVGPLRNKAVWTSLGMRCSPMTYEPSQPLKAL